MRNLKRALSLTLASVMLLGMMVVGAGAASYPDVDESNNIEAIEVLQAVKVMEGDSAGNFDPDRPVSRAEMAVIMALLLNLDYDYYRGTKTFNDVPNWCAPYVAACYANGIISGYNATTYGSADTVNAVQAASMMMRALGYFKFSSDYEGDFVLSTVKQASKIELFKGINANSMDPLTRNQVAQLALNALKTPIVEPDDNTITIKDANGNIIATGGQVNYVVTASSQAYARAIDDAESKGTALNGVQGYIIELGEKLYSGNLKLIDDRTDDFGRPARKWEYKGDDVGTYAKTELLKKEYTVKVTGKELYDLLGKDYDVQITIDGVDVEDKDASTILGDAYFTQGNLVRTNTNGVGGTGKGVLTQVFVNPDASPKTMVHIAIINTYLAKASEDYDTKNEEVDFNVFGLDNKGDKKSPIYAKDVDAADPSEQMTVKNEDIFVENVKEDDIVLVTVANGEIKSMIAPETIDSTTISVFKRNDYVTANGERYDHASTALYDVEVLEVYDNKNMKDLTYNIILDRYGYLIGLELNEDPDQYVFITGRQAGSNDLGNANADMRAIFLDGSVKVIEVNVKDSDIDSNGGAITNTWCKYTTDKNGIYTLEEIDNAMASGLKVAQSVQDVKTGASELTIDKKHVSLDGSGTFPKVYGNDNTVYLEVSLSVIGNASSFDGQNDDDSTTKKYYTADGTGVVNADTTRAAIIDDVESVTTGVKNVSLRVNHVDKAYVGEGAGTTHVSEKLALPVNEIYTLYKDNGYVIAAVVIGESDGVSTNFAYITGDDYNSEGYDSAEDEWSWTLNAIVNGEDGELRALDSNIKHLKDMKIPDLTNAAPKWYKVKYDGNGNVRGKEAITFAHSAGKYIDAVELYEDSVEDNDTVLMMVDYTSTHGVLTYKDAGTLYTDKARSKGFSVSPNVKTVVALSKINKDKTVEAFDDVTDGYKEYKGLERALADLDSKAADFNGYLSVLFEDGVATVIILDDRTGTEVDTGNTTTPTGSYSSVVDAEAAAKITGDPLNLAKAKIDGSNKLKLPGVYAGGDNIKQQLLDALAHLGYTVTKAEIDATTATQWNFSVTKDNMEEKITCNTAAGQDVAKYYYAVSVDGKLAEYVASDGTSTGKSKAAATGTAPTGFIKTTDAGTTWAYTAYDGSTAYASSPSADVEIKTDYYKVTVPADVTTSGGAVIATTTVGKYTSVITVDDKGVRTSTTTLAVKADATVTVTITWASTDITGTKDTVTVTSTKGTVTGGAIEFAAGTYSDDVAKSATITTFTGDDTITITGANVTP